MGTVTNLQTVTGGDTVATDNKSAHTSRAGEDNSAHVAIAVGILAALAIGAGLINVKLSAGTGRS